MMVSRKSVAGVRQSGRYADPSAAADARDRAARRDERGTRLRLTAGDRKLLRAVGEHLAVARGHDLPAALRGEPQNARAKHLSVTFGIQARYAGSIVRANDAQVRLAREGRWRHKLSLQRGIAALERRLAATTRQGCGCGESRGCTTCRDGYATRNEWWTKRRRLDVLRARLVETDRRLVEKDYAIVFGGRRLLNTRHHLDKAGLTLEQWQQQWADERLFLACVGNVGKTGGNPCLTLTQDDDGLVWLTVSVPEPVQRRLGVASRVRLTHPVPVGHVPELVERVTAQASTAIAISFETGKRGEKVLLRASWTHEQTPVVPELAQLRVGRVVSLDLNADHLALSRLNPDGNPVGAPVHIPLELKGLPAGARDARIRQAITHVLEHAQRFGAVAVVVEELGFEQEKTREKHGRKKTFRALISGFPTLAFRSRLVAMAYRKGLAVIAVDPRYTSKAGGRDWQHILAGGPTATALSKNVATRHAGAAVAIGRRGLAHGLTASTPARARARAKELSCRPAPHQQQPPSVAAGDGSTAGLAGLVRLSDSARVSRSRPHSASSSSSQQSYGRFGVHPWPSGGARQR
jgi:IS605 OrfB family transposase